MIEMSDKEIGVRELIVKEDDKPAAQRQSMSHEEPIDESHSTAPYNTPGPANAITLLHRYRIYVCKDGRGNVAAKTTEEKE